MVWQPNVRIPDQASKASPALAEFGGLLHMVHLGDSSNDIWHSTFDGSSWSPNVKIPDQQSKASPALAEFGGLLHMVHLGDSSNDIWHSTFDGSSWSPNVKIPHQQSKASPALAEFGGLLHMVHLGDSSNDIWHSTFDGSSWSPNVKIPDQASKASPALAKHEHRGSLLFMEHLGDSSNDIWQSTFNGSSWYPNYKVPDQASKASPALAEFGGLLHMVHLGDSSNDIWHSTADGWSWHPAEGWSPSQPSPNVKIPDQQSKASPALAEFGGLLHMVHLGDSSNDIWHSTLALDGPEALIVELTNEKRQSVDGCAPVQLDARLLSTARAHSQDLASHPGLYDAPPPSGRPPHSGHYGSDGSLGWDESGIGGRITTAMGSAGLEGENVAYGFPTAEMAFDSWFNETPPNDGHRRNILNCHFKLIGVGIAQAPDGTRYYTQDFFG